MSQIYLAARYSRRIELCKYRDQLRALGYNVQARWLDGGHQLSDNNLPIGDSGEALVEAGDCNRSAELRAKFAQDDWEDVTAADIVVAFTDPPRSNASRGGRHVELGIALGQNKEVLVIGYRENIFCWLPQVHFFLYWNIAVATRFSRVKEGQTSLTI